MTYDSDERSQRAGKPIELYRFSLGTTTVLLTNSGAVQTFQSQQYLPAAITRSSPTYSPEKVGSELTIELAIGEQNAAPVADAFIRQPPAGLSRVVLFRVHPTGSVTWWRGFVVSSSEDQRTVSLLCRPFGDIVTKTAPRRGFGVLCQHVLFDGGCKLSEANFAQVVSVIAVSADRTQITVSGLSAPQVRYDGGTLSRTGGLERGLIIGEAAGVITLRYPLAGVNVGDTVEVVEGCRHDLTDCTAFANTINFGGFPYTPLGRNPFARGLDKV